MAKPDASEQSVPHVPVLMAEVLEALAPLPGSHIVDGTFGAGGYSRALLEAGASVTAIDRDPNVKPFADALSARFPSRFKFVAGAFAELDQLVSAPVDGVVLDIGVSSMQLDEADRGFSFMRDGPLDMRMAGEGDTAADLVNGLAEADLADLLFAYGEERKSRRIAHSIVAARAAQPIATTAELARLIEKSIGRKPGDAHPATRSFQALRIAVNDEFGQLVEGLFASERLLVEGGRLAVVTFHSLEDRIVKRFLDPDKGGPAQSRHLPQAVAEDRRWLGVAKAVKPSASEVTRNPRARSAILRAAHRSVAAARPVNFAGLGVPRFKGAA
ncbi:MAG: 16S rRNA (cytosine(1402)-N(4))-methyltransferase RsmH [Devosia sp.]|uniref:16S rRNA (cytosine(1402)-N(4))-methyltransferase RsmH n=1 Tax=Devosia sp. TaxID=1871048 RepID=UPI001A3C52BA|nr:16S rRNA (cytosine(1402)-N(4))-methyltransferase RsmH [Devosia sp.]MBL8598378.1 16S rRNA (cytosine(1402)-N(4))-methyltransferase RsmH [Devosia sp.]